MSKFAFPRNGQTLTAGLVSEDDKDARAFERLCRRVQHFERELGREHQRAARRRADADAMRKRYQEQKNLFRVQTRELCSLQSKLADLTRKLNLQQSELDE